jgi:hypothetical protein
LIYTIDKAIKAFEVVEAVEGLKVHKVVGECNISSFQYFIIPLFHKFFFSIFGYS